MKKIIIITILAVALILTACGSGSSSTGQEGKPAEILSVPSENTIHVKPLWDFEGYEEVVVHFNDDTIWFESDLTLEVGQTIGLVLADEIMESFPPQVIALEVTSLE